MVRTTQAVGQSGRPGGGVGLRPHPHTTDDVIQREASRLVNLIRQAISDPGAYTPRGIDNPEAHPDDQEPENVRSWGARSVVKALAENRLLLSAPARVAASAESGAGLIAAERRRQVEVEGWTPEHDDHHTDGELAAAALAYALAADPDGAGECAEDIWPWDDGWRPHPDPVRNLVKAGALIAAEIDRLQRRTSPEDPAPFVSPDGPIPGYVAGRCGHRVAESEWRAGFRTCERCPGGVTR